MLQTARHAKQHTNASANALGNARTAFTLVELLVTIGIIVLLLGVLSAVVGVGTRRAQMASTTFLMNSISQGIETFRGDHGYVPPVLGLRDSFVNGQGRDVLPPPAVAVQNYKSFTTLADFLLGYGSRLEDGYGGVGVPAANSPGSRETPGLGFRSPTSDGCWGAIDNPWLATLPASARGYFRYRNPLRLATNPAASGNTAIIEGRVYGPYLDLKDESSLAGLAGYNADGSPILVMQDQGVANFDAMPKVIVDYWGQPITFYRRPYLGTDLKTPNLQLNLGDVFCLRPWEFRATETAVGIADGVGDSSTSAGLVGATFALFSAGPDKRFNALIRADSDQFNVDNLVETGR
ncbi:MAG: type II secretion system protein [Phycisphaerales bacterium]|nr:type II secretion system protein [Phycisphaerales bacterium]